MDFSHQYALMGAVYAWASPEYVLDKMTEVQVFGYLQHVHPMQDRRFRHGVAVFLPAIWEHIILRIFPRK